MISGTAVQDYKDRSNPQGFRRARIVSGGLPSVSVIVPCYNYGRYLTSCVDSILSQGGVEVSVLIIDDSSDDDSAEVAATLARADGRVRLLRHRVNMGHIATYNEGLGLVSGEYVLLLSADDLLAPGALARAAAVFEAYPNVGLVYGRAVLFEDGSAPPRPRTKSGALKVWRGEEWVATRCMIGQTGIESPEVLMRTELHHAIGGYRPELPHTGDSELWLRAAHHADVAFISADQAYHRTHPSSMSTSRYGSLRADYIQRDKAFEVGLLGGDRRSADAARLCATARRALAADLLWRMCRLAESPRSEPIAYDELMELAAQFYPDVEHLSEWHSLRWRRCLGGRARYAVPVALPAMVLRRVRRLRSQFGELWWRNLGS